MSSPPPHLLLCSVRRLLRALWWQVVQNLTVIASCVYHIVRCAITSKGKAPDKMEKARGVVL